MIGFHRSKHAKPPPEPHIPFWKDERVAKFITARSIVAFLMIALIAFVVVIAYSGVRLIDQGNALARQQNQIQQLQHERHLDALEREKDLHRQIINNQIGIRNAVCFILSKSKKPDTSAGKAARKRYHCPPQGQPFHPRHFLHPPKREKKKQESHLGGHSSGARPSNTPRANPAPSFSPTPTPTTIAHRSPRPTVSRSSVKPSSSQRHHSPTPTRTRTSPKPSPPTTSVPPIVCISLGDITIGC